MTDEHKPANFETKDRKLLQNRELLLLLSLSKELIVRDVGPWSVIAGNGGNEQSHHGNNQTYNLIGALVFASDLGVENVVGIQGKYLANLSNIRNYFFC